MTSSEPPRRPTINDVARRAGVSKSLVSLVMRDSDLVSRARREAVLAAARELGYRPNAIARSLVEARTRTIGVIVSDLRNPWYVDVLDGFRHAAAAGGFRVLIGGGQLADRQVDRSVVEAFLDLRVEGLCVIGVLPYDEALAVAISSVPSVVTSSHSYQLPHVDSVVNDDENGTRQATEHLIGLGHQRIAHIGGGPDGVAQARLRGYERAMREHGLGQHICVEECDYDEPSGHAAASRLLAARRQPTAIVAVNDLAAVGALSAADDAGLPLPGGLSVVGYDNTSLAAVGHLSLSSVDPRSTDIGELAGQRIMARIAGGELSAREDAHRDLIPPLLVVRRSTTHPRGTTKSGAG